MVTGASIRDVSAVPTTAPPAIVKDLLGVKVGGSGCLPGYQIFLEVIDTTPRKVEQR